MPSLQDPQKMEQVGQFYRRVTDANKDFIQYWQSHTFLHWDWWTSLALTIIPWLLWIRYRHKSSTARLLYAGFFVIIVSSWLDFVGITLGLWFYTGKLVPTMPSYMPWDVSLLPVGVMLLIQAKPRWSPLLKGLIFASLCAFVGEPIFMWLGFYVTIHWEIWYSFPIYLIIYLLADRLSRGRSFDPLPS